MNEEIQKLFEGVELSDEIKTALGDKIGGYTEGLVNNKNQVIQENRQFKDQMKTLQEQVSGFSGKEEELNKFKAIFDQNEEARLIADGKFQEVIDNKVNGYKTELETFKNSKNDEINGYNEKINGLQSKIYDYMLNEQISNVALKDGNFDKSDSSLELLKMVAKQNFKANDKGDFVFNDETKLDKDGNPLNFESWFNSDVKTKYGQLFTGVSGAGVTNTSKHPQHKGVDASAIGNMSMADYRKMRKG